MFNLAKQWVAKGGLGVPVAYCICCVASFLAIWAVIEPMDVGNWPTPPPELLLRRLTWHILASVLIGAYALLFFLTMALRDNQSADRQPTGTTFFPKNSVDFYDKIAKKYDDRNSASLYAAHEKVIDLIVERRINKKKEASEGNKIIDMYNQKVSFVVMDLGGGTGKLIATKFSRISSIQWHYVDESPLMLKCFTENIIGGSAGEADEFSKIRIITTLSDIEHYIDKCQSSDEMIKLFDVIIISFALTSMHRNPSWKKINNLLSKDGILIISDIDAWYTARFPYYSVQTKDGDVHLRPRSVPLSGLISEIGGDLRFISTHPIKQNTVDYAYVTVFGKHL